MPHKDPEKRKAYVKAYSARNAEKANERAKAWYEAHKNDAEFKKIHAERGKAWRAANRERYLAWRRTYRAKRMEDPAVRAVARAQNAVLRTHKAAYIDTIIAEAKARGCPCGEREFVALDLHHLDPATKKFSVGRTRYQKLHRPDEIRDEVAKCVPLCANCHRKQQSLARPRQAGFYGRERLVLEAKRVGCTTCGETERVCLIFHHLDPSTKLFKLSDWGKKGITQEMVREEIAKCVLLCENCHRKVHAGLLALPSAAGSST